MNFFTLTFRALAELHIASAPRSPPIAMLFFKLESRIPIVRASYAVHLETGGGYGLDRHRKIYISPSDFQGPTEGAPDTAKDAVLLREQRPYSGTSRFQGHELLTTEKINSSPGPPSTSPSSVALPHLSRRNYLRVRVGNINPIPCRSAASNKHEHVFCVSADVSLGTDFSDPLGTDLTHVSTAVTLEPFSSFSPPGSH
ncbi:hypothetical protein JTE90_000812 [Oedothorax gibbosus]|uniref:Uncharacterized protein n=1 Tax=Oedothorax gibbosus TaxID=931172 RepID=A0AAV6TDU7_9ARAC|nr:hypothetical protein JTE90_000812 [Oedothorax gibbosus]